MLKKFPGGPGVMNPPSNAGDTGSIPGQGTRAYMPQQKIPCATTKIQCSQINKYFSKNVKKTVLSATGKEKTSSCKPGERDRGT